MPATSPIRRAAAPLARHAAGALPLLAALLLAAPMPSSAQDPSGAPRGEAPPAAAVADSAPGLVESMPERAEAPGAQPAHRIDLGDPSVLSQRGQRLRIAVPFGSAPGERVSATRFTVGAVSAPEGFEPPRADAFTVLKPERRNVVILQSREPWTAPAATIELRVAGQAPARMELAVPPVRYASAEAASQPAPAVGSAAQPGRRARASRPVATPRAARPAATPSAAGTRALPSRGA